MELPSITWFLVLLVLHPELAKSEECQQQLEIDMDLEEMACKNFHQYACGNWYASSVQRKLGAHDMRSKWLANMKMQLIRHLGSDSSPVVDSSSSAQLTTFYQSCMSSDQSLRSYTDALIRSSGTNFPLLQNNSNSSFDWIPVNAALRTYGAPSFWRLLVLDNWQLADQKIFYILSPTFDLLGHGDEFTEFFYERNLKMLLMELGLRVRRAAQLAANLVEFEKSLRNLTPENMENLSVLREPQKLRDLELELPELQLRRYFDTILQGLDWDPSTLLLVADIGYLRGLQGLLAKQTDPLILSTWLLLQLPLRFEYKMHEDEKLSTQQVRCLDQLRKLMPGALGRLEIELMLGENYQDVYDTSIQQTALLFRDLKQQFELSLNRTEVFNEDLVTRNLAVEKLRAMRLLTPRLQDPTGHAATGATPLGSNLDENLIQLSLNQARLEFRQAVFGAEAVTSMPSDPFSVNAYYRLKLNRIELPLGLMATPLAREHHCPKEAGLGFILAHEMMHALDYDGINYDATGQLANGQWPARAIIRFGVRANCYIDLYGNATVAINENVADSEGLRLALDTFRRRNGTQNLRDFFVTYAQNWCGTSNANLSGIPQMVTHSGHVDRVNKVVANLPEFGEAFHCTTTSLMNPINKCRIW
ncbi:neprilysin-3 [Drosophila rhopaloa]|uniref:Neprilysin-1 n=1 Tax=Drosophila rhopaloa TaxID=1041015 RepID=A0A6P4FDW3_DRORH|nr:neprilysin-3 [Drosophila rhopaloa]